jgi:hypothetical protein
MFTFAAVTAPSRSVPVVRTMLDAVVGRIMGGTAAPDTITKGPFSISSTKSFFPSIFMIGLLTIYKFNYIIIAGPQRSHYFKMVCNLFDSFPTEFLLSLGTDTEGKIAAMLELLGV